MKRILVIRRDNIGDLVCTTPMLRVLRRNNPDAWVGVLANRYNAAILNGNTDVDQVFSYRKAKHRAAGESRWPIWRETAVLMLRLRLLGIDIAVVASPGGTRYARMIGARRIIEEKPDGQMHEVERCVAMLGEIGDKEPPGPLRVTADTSLAATLSARCGQERAGGRRIGVHISARRPKQRWPAEAFVAAIREILDAGIGAQVLLFWSPGSNTDPTHPGDDEKLAEIAATLNDRRVVPLATHRLDELVAGLSLCDLVLCSDGGAMHIAAGLGKPLVCLFGDSDVSRWHPWQVPCEIIRPESHDVVDVTHSEVITAFQRLIDITCTYAPQRQASSPSDNIFL